MVLGLFYDVRAQLRGEAVVFTHILTMTLLTVQLFSTPLLQNQMMSLML